MSFPSSLDVMPVEVEVPATSANLGPGFDCLGLALSLHNSLSLRMSTEDFLESKGEGALELRGQTTTLAHQSARRVFSHLGFEVTGLAIEMENAIPFARGLGSSSAAIVAGMLAANQMCARETGKSLSQTELLNLAAQIEGHPDNVAPAILGGAVAAVMTENGETRAVSIPVLKWPRFVVFIPDVHLKTEVARGVLPAHYSRADAIFNLSRSALLVAALATADFAALQEALQDRIHQPFRAPLVPGWNELQNAALEAGALGVTLSGAGPTLLVWCENETAPVAQSLEIAARAANVSGRVLLLDAEPNVPAATLPLR